MRQSANHAGIEKESAEHTSQLKNQISYFARQGDMMWYLWLFVLEAAVIVTGNVTVLVVFTRTPALRKRKHYLLVSLAVADLLVGVFSVPMYVTMSFLGFRKIIYQFQDISFATASVFGLAAVAIERAYAVYFPFKHRTLRKGAYIIGIAVIWIMAVSVSFWSIYFDGLFTIKIVLMTAPIIFSLVIIMVSYLLMWVKMNCMTSVQGHAIHERDNRLTVTLLVVTVISLIAWTPFQTIVVYEKLCQHKCFVGKDIHILVGIVKFLQYGNSLVNPIIYALRMPQFKKAVFNAVRCCKQDQLAAQVPNGRPEPNRARVTNTFTADDCQGPVVYDSTSTMLGRDGIQMIENNEEDTSL